MNVAERVCHTLLSAPMRLPDLCAKMPDHDPQAIARCVRILSTSGHIKRLPSDYLKVVKPFGDTGAEIRTQPRRRAHVRVRLGGESYSVPGRIRVDAEGQYVELHGGAVEALREGL